VKNNNIGHEIIPEASQIAAAIVKLLLLLMRGWSGFIIATYLSIIDTHTRTHTTANTCVITMKYKIKSKIKNRSRKKKTENREKRKILSL